MKTKIKTNVAQNSQNRRSQMVSRVMGTSGVKRRLGRCYTLPVTQGYAETTRSSSQRPICVRHKHLCLIGLMKTRDLG